VSFGPRRCWAAPRGGWAISPRRTLQRPVQQLYFNGSAWSQQSLTQATHGASAETSYGDSWIAACVSGNYQFIFFTSPDFHLHEFSYINNWQDTDLTFLTGLTSGGSSPAAFITPGIAPEIDVYYSDTSGHVHEFWSSIVNLEDNGDYDLTALTGASTALEGAVGFATTPNDQQHFYTRANNGVEQFYFNGSNWSAQDLAGGNYWKPYGLAGFAVGNLHTYITWRIRTSAVSAFNGRSAGAEFGAAGADPSSAPSAPRRLRSECRAKRLNQTTESDTPYITVCNRTYSFSTGGNMAIRRQSLALGAIFVLLTATAPLVYAQQPANPATPIGSRQRQSAAVAPTAATETVLHSFASPPKGASSCAGLIRDSAGNLYGTTISGGAAGVGVVFKLSAAGHESVLYSFTGGADGSQPYAGVIRDSAGNLYGTTLLGGAAGTGVVFKVNTSGQETVLYSFTGGADGGYPQAGVIRDSAGNLYGTTASGGTSSRGVVYKVNTSGQETVLYSFTGGADGSTPESGVIRDSAGNLYGTTVSGGTSFQGVVYKVNTSGQETVLYNFTGGVDGSNPQAGVIRDSAGDLYGTTTYGGTAGGTGFGVVYKLNLTTCQALANQSC